MTREVGIWIRVSTDDQAKGEGPAVHRERALGYATAKGWTVTESYDLSGVSGKSVAHHTECQRMLQDIASGKIKALIFSKLARLSRNTVELIEFSNYFNKYEADLVAVDESLDTSTPAGRLVFTVMAALAQNEREEIQARTAASVPIRAKMGKPLGGVAPFGYLWKNGDFILNLEEAPVRKCMFEIYLELKTLKGVTAEMNRRGYRSRNGKEFSPTTIRKHLTDPCAKGVRIANYLRATQDGKAAELKPEEDWVRLPCEPIVSVEVWDEVNRMITTAADRYRQDKTNRGRAKHLFSGLVYCGQCQGKQKLYPLSKSKNYVCRECRQKIPKDDLETLFVSQASTFLVDEEKVMDALDRQQSKWKEAKELLVSSEKELRTVQKRIDNCIDLYGQGAIGVEEVKKQMKPLESQKAQLEQTIPELRKSAQKQREQTSRVADVIADGQSMTDEWEQYVHERKRSIVENMVERIVITGKEVLFELVYLTSLKFMAEPNRNRGIGGFAKGVFNRSDFSWCCCFVDCGCDCLFEDERIVRFGLNIFDDAVSH
jgi:site-specific DNA recombinase